jgi:hypothetical protein
LLRIHLLELVRHARTGDERAVIFEQRRNLNEIRDRLAAGSRLRGCQQALLRISPKVLEAGEWQRHVIDNPGHDPAVAADSWPPVK